MARVWPKATATTGHPVALPLSLCTCPVLQLSAQSQRMCLLLPPCGLVINGTTDASWHAEVGTTKDHIIFLVVAEGQNCHYRHCTDCAILSLSVMVSFDYSFQMSFRKRNF